MPATRPTKNGTETPDLPSTVVVIPAFGLSVVVIPVFGLPVVVIPVGDAYECRFAVG